MHSNSGNFYYLYMGSAGLRDFIGLLMSLIQLKNKSSSVSEDDLFPVSLIPN